MTQFSAVLADDEPLLLGSLKAELLNIWPELMISALAQNGAQALEAVIMHRPDVIFLDIRMPGITGLEVARQIIEDAPNENAIPIIVFVTAYDQYATEAFDSAALDYVLKPINTERLTITVTRIKRQLEQRSGFNSASMEKLALLLSSQHTQPKQTLKYIRAGLGDAVNVIPIEQVQCFEADDKYVVVHSNGIEHLVRQSLKELTAQLDNDVFVQIHRSTLVNMALVDRVEKDELGKLSVSVKGLKKKLAVSRVYAHLFKAM
jgi:DNA-binding LytR/AlgR family response regulator